MVAVRSNEDGDFAESQSIVSSESLTPEQSNHASVGDALESSGNRNHSDVPDTRSVVIVRVALIVVWLVAAIVFSVCIYAYTSRAEENEFRKQFSTFAAKSFDAFQCNVEQSLYMLDLLSISYTSYAVDRNLVWPFVTFPDFEVVAARARHLVQNGGVITFAPIVSEKDREQWERYSFANRGQIAQALEYRRHHPQFYHDFGDTIYGPVTIPPVIWSLGADNLPIIANVTEKALPVWQSAPIQNPPIVINYNLLSIPSVKDSIDAVVTRQEAILSKFLTVGQDLIPRPSSTPLTALFYPVFQTLRDTKNKEVVGIISVELFWENFLKRILPSSASGIFAVLENTCGQIYTFEILGEDASYLGEGDLHDHRFDSLMESRQLESMSVPGLVRLNELGCQHSMTLYPSGSFRESFVSNKPRVYTVAAASIFLFTFIVLLVYDWLIKRRHSVLKREAKRSNAIVTSLFPTVVRDRLLRNAEESPDFDASRVRNDDPCPSRSIPTGAPRLGRRLSMLQGVTETPKTKLKTFLNDAASTASSNSTRDLLGTAPIADLFPSTTVMFADIAGFTAWCSEREPTQVFILLETIYCAFDKIAKLNGVFKVETIGDCYVAVTGLPDPQEDHAVIMASFAKACIKKMQKLTKKLEATLGPGTADLAIRVGLHSGPVTAGVLRGDKSRFQLFGDTVNTASRMESNGERDRIHVSEETAMLLAASGRKHWIRPREDVIVAKGKGNLQTYWLLNNEDIQQQNSCVSFDLPSTPVTRERMAEDAGESPRDCDKRLSESSRRNSEVWGSATLDETHNTDSFDVNKVARLVDWNVDVLMGRLKGILASRQDCILALNVNRDAGLCLQFSSPRDEVAEIISLPDFDPAMAVRRKDPASIHVEQKVVSQLRTYVSTIASMYRNNPFHNFEHASHVSMSSNKLLQRIISPDEVDYRRGEVSEKQRRRAVASDLHDLTFGIASDPLTQFAVVFAAVIHDVDHSGLSNTQIVQQRDPIADKYQNKSVAEQNSVDLAWNLLMKEEFIDLRRCIYSCESEAKRFRQLVVNSVVATDLFDAELRTLRVNRWEKAFRKQQVPNTESEARENLDRRATTTIEHIIQASDVAHTMQHWHIYQRWNKKLFHEQFRSFLNGLGSKDPSLNWYQGELDFFDNYIIPLANKLKESGVFGVSGDEYLIYAQENRKEWALKGETIVSSWREHLSSDDDDDDDDDQL